MVKKLKREAKVLDPVSNGASHSSILNLELHTGKSITGSILVEDHL